MTIKALLATAAGVAMMTTGTMAAAAPAAPAPADQGFARAGAASAHDSRLGASVPTTTLISIGILAALVVIVLVATRTSNSTPKSP